MYHEEPDQSGGTLGNWYFYTDYGGVCLFSVPMNGYRSSNPAGERFTPAPYVAAMRAGTMFYNNDTNQFMYAPVVNEQTYYSANTYYAESIPNEPDASIFKFNDPNNDGLLYMDARAHSYGNGTHQAGFAIVKMKNGTFKYIEFSGTTANAAFWGSYAAGRLGVSVFPASSNIANAKFIARPESSRATPYLYYVTNDNKVWAADVSNPSAVVETEITNQILKDDGYSEITLFKYTLPESAPGENDTDPRFESRTALAVATYNPSLGKDNGGKLEFFSITDFVTGKLSLAKFPDEPFKDAEDNEYQKEMSWKDLGRIVGLTYKSNKQ
jgi:hypothetical protein